MESLLTQRSVPSRLGWADHTTWGHWIEAIFLSILNCNTDKTSFAIGENNQNNFPSRIDSQYRCVFPSAVLIGKYFFYPRTRAYALSRNSEGMLWCLRLIAYYSFGEYMKGYTCREASYIPNLCRITHPHVDFSSVVGVFLSRELGFSTQVIYPKVMEIAYYLDQCRAISIFTTRFICPPQRDSAETKLSYTNINKCKGTHHIWISPEAIRSLRIVQRL